MHLDVLDLRQFYYRTRLGRAAQAAIRGKFLDLWPEETSRGATCVGYGFAVPLLRPYLDSAQRVIALMPGPQGVMHWPADRPNVSVLCSETLWPIETGSVDRLVCMHGLETSDQPAEVLEEAHRVLGPGGRAIFIVPNRVGLWARRDGTPFGFGRPYSQGQLDDQLKRHAFVPERHATALYVPPSSHPFWLKSANMCERTGQKVSGIMSGGVIMVEVSKQAHKRVAAGMRERLRNPLRVLDAVTSPEPKPV